MEYALNVGAPLNTKYVVCTVISCVIFAGGYLTGASNVDTQTNNKESEDKTKVVERVVVRTVTVTEKPDGTKVTETKDKVAEKDRESTAKTSEDTSKSIARAQWSVGANVSILNSEGQNYTVTVHRRVIGNLWGGIYARSDLGSIPELGVGIRIDF